MLPKILIVDDEKDNIDALKRLLRKDFEVYSALSGEEGIEQLKMLVPKRLEVIVSDQRMPGMQGSEFLEKASTLDPLITRILLTGFSDIEAMVEAVNRGQIWRYISKPWEPDDIIITIKQAAERSRLQRSLGESRTELERALDELRAKDWARERLLQILLHEFRTAPQTLEALKSLDPGGDDGPARLKFIENLESRFNTMSSDISDLLADERKITLLPKESLDLLKLIREFCNNTQISLNAAGPENANGFKVFIQSHRATLEAALQHFLRLMQQNTAKSDVSARLEWDSGQHSEAFFSLIIKSPNAATALLPDGLANVQNNPSLAWPLLLEPFVGVEDFTRHSSGLRVETARYVRHLNALGAKLAFQVSPQKDRVELLIVFKT